MSFGRYVIGTLTVVQETPDMVDSPLDPCRRESLRRGCGNCVEFNGAAGRSVRRRLRDRCQQLQPCGDTRRWSSGRATLRRDTRQTSGSILEQLRLRRRRVLQPDAIAHGKVAASVQQSSICAGRESWPHQNPSSFTAPFIFARIHCRKFEKARLGDHLPGFFRDLFKCGPTAD